MVAGTDRIVEGDEREAKCREPLVWGREWQRMQQVRLKLWGRERRRWRKGIDGQWRLECGSSYAYTGVCMRCRMVSGTP